MKITDARSRQKKSWNEINYGEVFLNPEDSVPIYCMKVTTSIYVSADKIQGFYVDLEDGYTYSFIDSPDVPRFEVLDTAEIVIK